MRTRAACFGVAMALFLGGMGQVVAQSSGAPSVRVLRGSSELAVTVVALPDPRVTRVVSRRSSARRRGRAQCVAAIRAFIDRELTRFALDPQRHAALHEAVARHLRIVRAEPLVDHGVRMEARLSFTPLSDLAPLEGIVWSP